MGPIQKIEGDIHGQNAQEVKGDQLYFDNVDTFLQNNHNCNDVKVPDHVDTFFQVNIPSASKTKKIWEYILSYMLVFFVGVFFIMLLGVAYIALISGKFQTVNQKALTFMGIVFLGFVTASVVHWLIKLPNLRQQRRDTN